MCGEVGGGEVRGWAGLGAGHVRRGAVGAVVAVRGRDHVPRLDPDGRGRRVATPRSHLRLSSDNGAGRVGSSGAGAHFPAVQSKISWNM